MPTLDDAPTIEVLVGDDLTSGDVSATTKIAQGDLIQVFDVSEQKAKVITVQELGEALGVTFTTPSSSSATPSSSSASA